MPAARGRGTLDGKMSGFLDDGLRDWIAVGGTVLAISKRGSLYARSRGRIAVKGTDNTHQRPYHENPI